MAIRITEIHRNGRFRLVSVTEIHRSPYRGPGGFGRSTPVSAGGGVNSPFLSSDSYLGHEHTGALDSLFWNNQQPAMPELSDEELAHAYFAAP